LVVGALALVRSAGAVAGTKASAPPPSLSSLALATTDFQPGARVLREKTQQSGSIQVFTRTFAPGVRIGTRILATAVSEVLLYTDAGSATTDFAFTKSSLATKRGRDAIAKSFVKGFVSGSKLKVKKTIVGSPLLGAQSIRWGLTMKTSKGSLNLVLDFVQVDRVVEIVLILGLPNQRVAGADAGKALTEAKARLVTGFTVASTAPPTISGTPAQGQTLTVDEGTWTGAPASYTYVWQRCDSVGTNCAPIAGATANTYVPTAGDSGSTLDVVVTGQNTVSSAPATSPATPVVP
jgi:hypothetical protein